MVSDTNVNFSCLVTVVNVSWAVNGVRLDDFTSTTEFNIVTHLIDLNSTLSVLSTRAKSSENNTEVMCIATGNNPSIMDSRTAHILIAGELIKLSSCTMLMAIFMLLQPHHSPRSYVF